MKKFTAAEILKLLAQRHAEDVFVPECKNGPTGTEHLRMDAWSMAKSWSRPLVVGYEIKVSRADFLGDNKWHAYLPLCNQLYFATAPDIVKPDEIPEHGGLLVVAGSRLLTKKKAPYRDVTIPENLFRYVLMCRARIGEEMPDDRRKRKVQQWREFLAQRDDERELGHCLRYEISGMLANSRMRLEEAKKLEAKYEPARLAMVELGIQSWEQTPERIGGAVKAQFERLNAAMPSKFFDRLETLRKDIYRLMAEAKPIQKAA